MQPSKPEPFQPANGEDNRQAFWEEMKRLAILGVEEPRSLTPDQVQRVCRLVLVGMTRRDAPRSV